MLHLVSPEKLLSVLEFLRVFLQSYGAVAAVDHAEGEVRPIGRREIVTHANDRPAGEESHSVSVHHSPVNAAVVVLELSVRDALRTQTAALGPIELLGDGIHSVLEGGHAGVDVGVQVASPGLELAGHSDHVVVPYAVRHRDHHIKVQGSSCVLVELAVLSFDVSRVTLFEVLNELLRVVPDEVKALGELVVGPHNILAFIASGADERVGQHLLEVGDGGLFLGLSLGKSGSFEDGLSVGEDLLFLRRFFLFLKFFEILFIQAGLAI